MAQKKADKPMSKSEVVALLKGAKTAVPGAATAPQGAGAVAGKVDSLTAGTAPGSGAAGAPVAKPKSWRSAGLRASEFSEIATSLYWKM